MDKTFSLSYSSSQITYAEAVEFLRFRFHRKDRFQLPLHIPGTDTVFKSIFLSLFLLHDGENKHFYLLNEVFFIINEFESEGFTHEVKCNQNVLSKKVADQF